MRAATRWLQGLSTSVNRCLGLVLLLSLSAPSAVCAEKTVAAPDDRSGDRDDERDDGRGSWHVGATLGWFGAVSGPLRHGPAAQLELLPGGRLGRIGFGLYYRGDRRFQRGSLLAGAVYEAGAARPGLVMTLHAAAGYDAAHSLPVVGVGWRILLGVAGPLVVSSNLTAQLFLDGVQSRLGIAFGLTFGVAR